MVATLCVHAQDEDELVNEVGISYGIVANSNFLDVYTESISGKSGTYFGPLALEYFHHLTPMISVGGVGVCKSHKETINGIELTNLYYTIMPAVKFSWYTTNHFGFYSEGGCRLYHICHYGRAKEHLGQGKERSLQLSGVARGP